MNWTILTGLSFQTIGSFLRSETMSKRWPLAIYRTKWNVFEFIQFRSREVHAVVWSSINQRVSGLTSTNTCLSHLHTNWLDYMFFCFLVKNCISYRFWAACSLSLTPISPNRVCVTRSILSRYCWWFDFGCNFQFHSILSAIFHAFYLKFVNWKFLYCTGSGTFLITSSSALNINSCFIPKTNDSLSWI